MTLLSPCELEVTALYATGIGTREVAEKLGKSINTVEVQRFSAYRKTGSKSLVQLVLWYQKYERDEKEKQA